MSTRTDTVTRQSPTALLALVQHINDHGLGTPLTIHSPSTASPYFTVAITSGSIDAWTAAGLVVDEVEAHQVGDGPIAGKLWERVTCTGRVLPHGIRVRVTFSRPMPAQPPAPRRLASVTAGGVA
jgi:hypothetical protein